MYVCARAYVCPLVLVFFSPACPCRVPHHQRETINHARDTLHGADDNITKSRKVLSSMARRFFQNKMIMYGIILMLVTAIALIIYFKVNGNKS